ncbi:MAG: imidazole glycerol phosphate synthase subunit HisH [Acidobacteria bacterium]|nr:imidazole glycerol phosphate synthase subunit HisH [Acidobacteriota bacterium]
MIALIDYGAGNLTSVRKALAAVGAKVFTPAGPQDLAPAHAMIVPGVGHFDSTRALDEGWREAIQEAVHRGAPLLGICVGLQWLFEGSTEAPGVTGLGVFSGMCTRLGQAGNGIGFRFSHAPPEERNPVSLSLKVPHVGWNSLVFPRASALMNGVPDEAQVYFTHSYAAPVVADTVAVTTYAGPFTAAVERGPISGVQFHPEKSGDVGLRVLRNWLETL